MEACLKNNVKSAKERLDDFEKMMERLKPYLPKIPKYKPKPRREWKIANPYELPIKPK